MERLTREEAASIIGEGIHTGARKASDDPASVQLWKAINDLPDNEWNAILEFTVDGLASMEIYLVNSPGQES